jgi:hypothetical protein
LSITVRHFLDRGGAANGALEPPAALEVPADADGRTIHVILEVTDHGEPALTRYRRLVVTGATAAVKK